jgi:hypothetical protein
LGLTPDQIAQAFCSHRFVETYPYMADESAKFLEAVSATITKLDIHHAETFVVVEGTAQFQDQENKISSVASCDIFQFASEGLVRITSYVIDLNKA